MIMSYRGMKLYLNGVLKEEKEFAKTRTEDIDIEQSKEAIENLEKAIDNPELEEIVKQWNRLQDELKSLKNKATRIDFNLGKYFEHHMK